MLSRSVCPIHICTVRRSTPERKARVANVARNLCSQKSFSDRPARLATALQILRKWPFGEQLELGKTSGHLEWAFAFHRLSD